MKFMTLEDGQRVLLVEDLTTDGRTKSVFCDGLDLGSRNLLPIP